jgi:hypothetical protein
MIALIALVLKVLIFLAPASANEPVMVIPPMPATSPVIDDEYEWSEFHADAVKEYADEFTALFNSYECKRAKNGAMMIRRGNSGSYKFCKKG